MTENPYKPPKEGSTDKRRGLSRGFFGKYNRRATRKSVIVAACLGAVASFTLAGLQVASKDFPGGYLAKFAVLAAMIVVGAIAGAAVEWQT